VSAAARRLHYDLTGLHAGLVVWGTPRTADAVPLDLEAVATRIAEGIGSIQRLVAGVSPGEVWAWATVASAADATDRFNALEPPSGARAVMGSPAPGIEGFRSSHREATAAHRLLLTLPMDSPAVAYESVDLLSLLMTDQERAVDFARRELGELGAQTPQAIDLRRTLATFLELRGSTHQTSQRLFISRNTVAYRIRRAEELLGRPVTARAQQLHAALAIVEALGGLDSDSR
jgi:DNA-binding PucR family transcriptional regulator